MVATGVDWEKGSDIRPPIEQLPPKSEVCQRVSVKVDEPAERRRGADIGHARGGDARTTVVWIGIQVDAILATPCDIGWTLRHRGGETCPSILPLHSADLYRPGCERSRRRSSYRGVSSDADKVDCFNTTHS